MLGGCARGDFLFAEVEGGGSRFSFLSFSKEGGGCKKAPTLNALCRTSKHFFQCTATRRNSKRHLNSQPTLPRWLLAPCHTLSNLEAIPLRVAANSLSLSLLSDSLNSSLSLPCSSLQLTQPHALHNCSHHFSDLLVLCTSPHHFSLHISQPQALRDSLCTNCNNCDLLLLLLLPLLLTLHYTLFLQPLPCLYHKKKATRVSVPPHCSLHFLLKHSQLGRKASPS